MNLQDMYLGDGEVLSYQDTRIERAGSDRFAAYLRCAGEKPEVNTDGRVSVSLANGEKLMVE